MHEVDAFTMFTSKVDALFQRVDRLQPTPSHSYTLSGSFGQAITCEMCGVQRHGKNECQLNHSF